MKRPPVIRSRLSGFNIEPSQNSSLERIVQTSRNTSVELKEKYANVLSNVLGHKSRACSIINEKSYIEPKSSRESLSYAKIGLKKQVLMHDAYPRTIVSVSVVKNSFYSVYEHLQGELEKFEKIKMDLEVNYKGEFCKVSE